MSVTIGLDLDEVLRQTNAKGIEVWRQTVDPSFDKTVEEIRSWDLSRFFGDPSGRFPDPTTHLFDVHGETLALEAESYPMVEEVTRDLAARGARIAIVTSSPLKHVKANEIWLQKHGVVYHQLLVTNDKSEFVGDCLLDDAPHNLDRISNTTMRSRGTVPVCMDRPWNREFDGARRVRDLDEFRRWVLTNWETLLCRGEQQ